jgi:hypothetical protein
MKKRVLSLLMALTLCLTTLPTAVFADVTENGEGSGGTHYVAESGGTQYETVQEILENMEEGEITLLDSVTEDLTVYAATTIHMNGHSITGNIDATDSLTLNGGTVDGTVTVNATGGTFTMTAPAEAEAAITGGLNVVSGSAFVSGAQVGVKGTLYFDGPDMLISGAVKAVELDSAAEPAAKTLYGSATVNGDTAAEAGFDTDTYKVGGEIAKKLTNKPVGSTTPAAPSLTLTETSKSLTAGKTAVFTANYTGTDTLNAYVQGSAVNGCFTISQKNNGDGTYTVSVKIDEETPGGTYTLFVHEVGNTSVQASATITVIGLPDAAEVNGKQYKSLPRALAAAQDGDTVKLLADHVTDADALNALGEDFTFEQYASIVPVVTKTLTLDLNHKTVDYLEVGFSETNEETQKKETLATGNLTVTGEAAYGRISNLMFMAGALDIRSGEIGGSGCAGLFCDANSGSVTVSNGTVYGLTVFEGASVTVNGGSNHAGEWVVASGAALNITDGTFGDVQFTRNGTIAISGGTFKSIKIYIAEELQPLMSLLDTQKVHAFYKGDDVQDGNATELADVTVKEHTHAMVNNKCDCGLSCTHTNTEGASTIGKDGKCTTCGTQFAAKANGNYYKHLANALAESSVDRVTLVADDTLLADVTLNEDTIFYLNGHTVSGGGAIVVPSGKWLELREENETEKAGNAGAIRVEDGGSLIVGEDFTGTVQTLTVSEKADVKLLGGMYGTITGSREKAGTLLYNNNHALAFQKQDGSFVRYDQRIPSETPLENVTVDFCRHEQLTEACDGACEYCNGALGARIGSQGYWNLNTEGDGAVYHVKNGETIVLLKDSDPKFGSSLNSDCAYTIDLNGHSTINGWTVSAGAPKIVDSKGGGKISQLSIGSSLDLTLADLLPKGWDFQKSDGSWLSTTELKGKTASNVTVAQLPIQSMGYPTEMSMDYGGTGTLIVNVRGTGAVRFQWYKVEDGKATEVGSATAKNQFDLSALKLSAGNHTFRFSATCDGYKKMSQDIVVTVQKANIGSNRIMPPTAQENLTYTGQPQALITAGSVTSGGTMQYSLTENGTYSQNSPVGTDAGTYTVWYRVIGDANHNDTAPASVAVSIGQKPLTITGVTVASKLYDGTTNADITSVTFDNVTLKRDTDYTVTASFDEAGVGSGKNVTATVTLMGQAAKNYALEQSSFPTTGSIIKAAAPDFTKETALTIVNGHEKTYTVTLPALPTLETPKAYGALTYEIGEIKLNDGYYTSGAKVENGKLILPIQKNDVKTTGSVGTATVVIKSTNYEDITLTVNVSAKNRITPTGTPTLSKNAITYGDALNIIALSGKLHDNVNNVDVDGTFEWVDGTHIPVVGNGTYAAEWIFEPTDTEKYLTVSGRSNITVEKARQYGKLSMAGYTYGKTPSTPTLTDQTGDLNAQVTYSYAAADSGSVQTWDISNPPALNAGTYRMYASIGDTDNYYGFEAVYCEFVVAKATPTYTVPTGLTAKYGQALADVTLPDGWSWMDSSESVGGASTAAKTFQAKFTPKDTENYNTVENIELEVTVNKADGGNLKTVELEQKYTDASDHTYTPDWAGLPAGQDWTFSSEASIALPKQDFAADGNLLTYAISGGKAGDKITIILKASCNNYEDFTITLTITLTEKDNQQALRITGGTTVVYGQTLQLGTSGGSGSGAVTYTVTNGTGEATIDSNGVLTPVRIGSVTVTATKAGDSEYNAVTSSPVEITITKATPTGEPAYTKITASGKTLADAALGIGTITPAGGTIAWADPTTTEVVANKSYGWTYTPTDSTNYESINGSIKLWNKSTSSGGGSYYAPVVPDMPMVYWGCTGDAVKTLQDKLNALGYNSGSVDGIFGAKTYAAVTAFQKANSLGVDGIVGKLTWGKIYGVSPAMPVETTTVVGRPTVSYGSRGDAVRKLQELLNALGYDCGSVDGIFGSKTKAAVLAFQKANGLGVDGIVGPLTWGKLV